MAVLTLLRPDVAVTTCRACLWASGTPGEMAFCEWRRRPQKQHTGSSTQKQDEYHVALFVSEEGDDQVGNDLLRKEGLSLETGPRRAGAGNPTQQR